MDAYINAKRRIYYRNHKPQVKPVKSNRETPIKTSLPSHTVMDTIKEGFAFGVGSSIASNVVRKVSDMISGETNTEVKELKCENTKCKTYQERYEQCLKLDTGCYYEREEYEKCLKE